MDRVYASSVQHDGSGMKVEMVTLDHWMKGLGAPSRVDVIKLDVEGGELAVLEGARKLIDRFRPFIVCEALDESTNKSRLGRERLLAFLRTTITLRISQTAFIA